MILLQIALRKTRRARRALSWRETNSGLKPFYTDVTKTRNGERGTGNGERGTENGERGTGNGERGTGNGSLGTSVQRFPA